MKTALHILARGWWAGVLALALLAGPLVRPPAPVEGGMPLQEDVPPALYSAPVPVASAILLSALEPPPVFERPVPQSPFGAISSLMAPGPSDGLLSAEGARLPVFVEHVSLLDLLHVYRC